MKRILLLLICLSLLFSCEYQNNGVTSISEVITSQYLIDGMANGTLDLYLQGPQIFRYKGKPGIETIPIGNPALSEYEPCFVLHVSTGTTQATIVSSAIIMLDDLEVLNTSDFSKNSGEFTFEVCNITSSSVITIEVRGEPGSYIDVWIEGKLTGCPCSVADKDGNIYSTVEIGDQCWMAENLKTITYNDGAGIPLATGNAEWADLKNTESPAYCWYNDNIGNKDVYGALYNWYAVSTGKLCPVGWHVATEDDWYILDHYLDPTLSTSGGKLKETGYTHWQSPNTGATNEFGFTALPGGYRDGLYGSCSGVCVIGYWWTSTFFGPGNYPLYIDYANMRGMNFNHSGVGLAGLIIPCGCSVRCIKD